MSILSTVIFQRQERILAQFETAWLSDPPPDIVAFANEHVMEATWDSSSDRLAALAEIVKTDMDHRWRGAISPLSVRASLSRSTIILEKPFPWRPRTEDYLAVFPELGEAPSVRLALALEEYRVRLRIGDSPVHEEFFARFPELEHELGPRLRETDQELAIESGVDSVSRRRKVGRYELIEKVGQGAFGVVWKAWDPHLRREVAVKIPRVAHWLTPEGEGRFLREATATARLQHAGIVSVHDVGREGDAYFLVTELVHGETLAQRMCRGETLLEESVEIVAQLAEALDVAHRQGIVHRDIKPSNIMLDSRSDDTSGSTVADDASNEGSGSSGRSGRVNTRRKLPYRARLMDFGLAKRDATDTTMTRDGHLLGTPAYMSPEQCRDARRVDGRSDIYSLGIILYELTTGRTPFEGDAHAVIQKNQHERPQAPRAVKKGIPRGIEAITLKCLAKQPSSRYWTAGELADDLRRFLANETLRVEPAAGPVQYIQEVFLHWGALFLIPGILAIGVLLGRFSAQWRAVSLPEAVNAPGSPWDDLNVGSLTEQERQQWHPGELVTVLGEHRQRHWASATCIDYCPKLQLLVSGSEDGFVEIREAHGLQTIKRFRVKDGPIRSVIFLNEGEMIAAAGDDGIIRTINTDGDTTHEVLRDAQDAEWVQDMPVHLATNSDGHYFASISKRGVTLREMSNAESSRVLDQVDEANAIAIRMDQSGHLYVLTSTSVDEYGFEDDAQSPGEEVQPQHDPQAEEPKNEEERSEDHDADDKENENEDEDPEDADEGDGDADHDRNEGQNDKHDAVQAIEDDHNLEVRGRAFRKSLQYVNAGETPKKLRKLRSIPVSDSVGVPASLSIHEELGRMVVGGDQNVAVWDLREIEPIKTLQVAVSASVAMLNADGSLLIVGDVDGAVRAWSTAGKEPRFQGVFAQHQGPIRGMALDPENLVHTVGEDHTVRTISLAERKEIDPIERSEGETDRVTQLGATERVLFPSALSSSLLTWNPVQERIQLVQVSGNRLAPRHAIPFRAEQLKMTLAKSKPLVALAGDEPGVKVWDLESERGKPVHRTIGRPIAVAFVGEDRELIICDAQGEIERWNVETNVTAKVAAAGQNPSSAVISTRGDVAAAFNDGSLRLFKLDPPSEQILLPPGEMKTNYMQFTPDGKHLITDRSNAKLLRFSIGAESNAAPDELTMLGPATALLLSPNGEFGAAVMGDKFVYIFDPRTFEKHSILTSYDAQRATLAFSNDSAYLAMCDEGGRVRVWDVTREKLVRWWELPGQVFDIAFAADSRHLASANGDGTVSIFRLPAAR